MKIIAQRNENILLIKINNEKCRVLDLENKIFYKERSIHSVLARGYWEEYYGKQNLKDILKGIRIEN